MMNRKLELAQMMLGSLMFGMTIDEKPVFLTDVFCLTEDMRFKVSATDEEIMADEIARVEE